MAGTKINIQMPGLKKWAVRNTRTIKKLDNKRTLFGAAIIIYEQWVKRNIDKEGKLHNNTQLKWRKLSPATLQIRRTRKRRPTTSTNILKDTGQLRLRWHRIITNKFGKLISGVNYSSIHEYGGYTRMFGKHLAKIPRRKIFPTEVQGQRIIKPVVEAWFNKAVK